MKLKRNNQAAHSTDVLPSLETTKLINES